MSEEIKFCKDCKHYVFDIGSYFTNQCTKEYHEMYLVNGSKENAGAMMMRSSVEKCGHDAKWFEPKEAKNDATT